MLRHRTALKVTRLQPLLVLCMTQPCMNAVPSSVDSSDAACGYVPQLTCVHLHKLLLETGSEFLTLVPQACTAVSLDLAVMPQNPEALEQTLLAQGAHQRCGELRFQEALVKDGVVSARGGAASSTPHALAMANVAHALQQSSDAWSQVCIWGQHGPGRGHGAEHCMHGLAVFSVPPYELILEAAFSSTPHALAMAMDNVVHALQEAAETGSQVNCGCISWQCFSRGGLQGGHG